MESSSVFKKNYHIELSDVDFTKKLKVSSLFNYFQDIASEAVDNLGIGIETIKQNANVAWILIRIRVEMSRNPEINEDVTIETWCQQPKKIEFERDFFVRDAKGNIIAKAISTWVIFDVSTRELRKSELIAIEYPPIREERAIECKLGKLRAFGQPEMVYKKVVAYSDVDFNGHLNNARYVDFIVDCFPVENHKDYCIKSIEVSYINEALPGETIILYKDLAELNSNLIYIEGANEKENKTVFKSQVEIEKR